jgi:hypothetical protein
MPPCSIRNKEVGSMDEGGEPKLAIPALLPHVYVLQ